VKVVVVALLVISILLVLLVVVMEVVVQVLYSLKHLIEDKINLFNFSKTTFKYRNNSLDKIDFL